MQITFPAIFRFSSESDVRDRDLLLHVTLMTSLVAARSQEGNCILRTSDNCRAFVAFSGKKSCEQKSALSSTSSRLLKFADLFKRGRLHALSPCCPRLETDHRCGKDVAASSSSSLFLSFSRGFLATHANAKRQEGKDAAGGESSSLLLVPFNHPDAEIIPLLFPIPAGEMP